MSSGSELYLGLVVVAFGAFAFALAAVSWYTRGQHHND